MNGHAYYNKTVIITRDLDKDQLNELYQALKQGYNHFGTMLMKFGLEVDYTKHKCETRYLVLKGV